MNKQKHCRINDFHGFGNSRKAVLFCGKYEILTLSLDFRVTSQSQVWYNTGCLNLKSW